MLSTMKVFLSLEIAFALAVQFRKHDNLIVSDYEAIQVHYINSYINRILVLLKGITFKTSQNCHFHLKKIYDSHDNNPPLLYLKMT